MSVDVRFEERQRVLQMTPARPKPSIVILGTFVTFLIKFRIKEQNGTVLLKDRTLSFPSHVFGIYRELGSLEPGFLKGILKSF